MTKEYRTIAYVIGTKGKITGGAKGRITEITRASSPKEADAKIRANLAKCGYKIMYMRYPVRVYCHPKLNYKYKTTKP